MLSTLRNRFGVPGIVSVIALVFALAGGAFAANDSSSDDAQATASAKAKKGPRGPRGPKGATGAAGAQGAVGPAGPAGAVGPAGPAGGKGATGATGPQGLPGAAGAPGAAGPEGPEGKPWTAGGTLPPGETETGAWSTRLIEGGTNHVPVSFSLPLAFVPTVNVVTQEDEEEATVPAGCAGGSAGNPTAEPGNLCIYQVVAFASGSAEIARTFDPSSGNIEDGGPEVGKTGTIISVECEGVCITWGPWAVTAAN